MSSFEWMELQTLAGDIAVARSRLAEARSAKDDRSVRVLEQEINTAEARRARLLAHISDHVADGSKSPIDLGSAAGLGLPSVGAVQASMEMTEEPASEGSEAHPVNEAVRPAVPLHAATTKGDVTMWDQLTPQDIERAKDQLESRRAEMLARHAEELRSLDDDRSQLEGLEQAISAFLQKFTPSSADGSVVALDEERELRLRA